MMLPALDDWAWPERTFMARLSPASRRDVLKLGTQTFCPPGRVLIRQGDFGETVYLLRSRDRTVSACAKIASETGRLLAIRVSGEVVGELGALTPANPRSATVTVCTATIAHSIPGPAFLSFLNTHPDGWQILSRTIADRLAWSDLRRLDFGECSVPVRLARLLVEFAESYGRQILVERDGRGRAEVCEITVQLSYEELGNLVGAGVDAVGLAMKDMRAAGLACLHNRHIVVHDLPGLRNFGGPN
ncbi:Crp/Fnr family transcriptional regulator [Nocardia sp. NPDC088792]|uniref:Crp/Fnr family transcriptional regulator n=1 Tax=Nocardia sp. NPDC088792 TaxID=3364332 RepID=UPI003810347E